MRKQFSSSFYIFILAFPCWIFPSLSFSQEQKTDTLELESVTIFSIKNASNFRAGLKSIRVDSLVMSEKVGLSLAELLHENSPIFVKTYGRGATATVSFRGTGASHTQFYWNGLNINSPMSGGVDLSLVPLYFVDNVNIHFGQASMSLGSGGLGGAVSMSNYPDWSKKFGVKLFQSLGSFDTYSTGLNASYGSSTIKLQTRLFKEYSSNNFSYRNTARIDNPVEYQQNADYSRLGLLQEIYFRPNPQNIISAKIWAQENDRGIPKLMSSYSFDEVNRQIDDMLYTVFDWNYFGKKILMKTSSGLSYNNLRYHFNKISNEGSELPVLNSESQSMSWVNRFRVAVPLNPWLKLDVQTDYSFHVVRSYESILSSGYDGNQNHSVLRSALNANPTNRLSISLIVAEELFDKQLTPLMPSLSLEYRFFKNKNFAAKAAVGRNYHHPSLNDLYWKPGGNPSLKPESGLTSEAGIGYTHEKNSLKIIADFNLFTSEINNWIMWLPHLKGYWEPINLELVKARGFEVSSSLNYQVENVKLRIQGNYSYTRSSIENAGGAIRPESHGMQLPFIPIHSGGIVVNTIWKEYYFTYNFTHFSERFTTTSNNPNSFRRLYPYYMSSVSAGYNFEAFKKNFGLQFRVDNLLNENYQTILWRPMPGRNFSLMLKVEL